MYCIFYIYGTSQPILENRCTHLILAHYILWTRAVQRCPIQYIVQYTIHLVTQRLSGTTKLLSRCNTQCKCIKKLCWHYILHSFIQHLSETAAIVLKDTPYTIVSLTKQLSWTAEILFYAKYSIQSIQSYQVYLWQQLHYTRKLF